MLVVRPLSSIPTDSAFCAIRRTTFVVRSKPDYDGIPEASDIVDDDDDDIGEGPPDLSLPEGASETPFDYRFSVGQLPAWAKKQIGEENGVTGSDMKFVPGFSQPCGRWAQRVNDAPLNVETDLKRIPKGEESTLDEKSVIGSNGLNAKTLDSTALQDISVIEQNGIEADQNIPKAPSDEQVEPIIYPPSQDEGDEEIASVLGDAIVKDQTTKDGQISSAGFQSVNGQKETKCSTSIKDNKDNVILRHRPVTCDLANANEAHVDKPTRDTSLTHTNEADRGKPPADTGKEIVKEQEVSKGVGEGLFKRITRLSKRKQRRPSLSKIAEEDDKNGKNIEPKQSQGQLHTDDFDPSSSKAELIQSHEYSQEILYPQTFQSPLKVYVIHKTHELSSAQELSKEGSKKRKSKKGKKEDDESFQVTATRSSLKRRKTSGKSSDCDTDQQQSEKINAAEEQVSDDDADTEYDYDSLDDEDIFQNDADRQPSDIEQNIDEDRVHSILEQHFEHLAEDTTPTTVSEGKEEEYPVETPGTTPLSDKSKKGKGFLSRCRSSISAKFLSRSQKSQLKKSGQSAEDQRKRLEALAKVLGHNNQANNIPGRHTKQQARRRQKLAAKSEPNLLFEVPQLSKQFASKGATSNGRRFSSLPRASKDTENTNKQEVSDGTLPTALQLDLISKDSATAAKRRNSSTSTISPIEPEVPKSTADLISMFDQRSSTPKVVKDGKVIPVKGPLVAKHVSPVASPIGSPVRKTLLQSPDKPRRQLRKSSDSAVAKRSEASGEGTPKKQKKSGERPGMQGRPKSMVLPGPISLDTVLEASSVKTQSQSDTEGDENEPLKYLRKSHGRKEQKSVSRDVRLANRLSENRGEQRPPTSPIVREIDIDDKIAEDSKIRSAMRPSMPFELELEKPQPQLYKTENPASEIPVSSFNNSPSVSNSVSSPGALYFYETKIERPTSLPLNPSPPERDVSVTNSRISTDSRSLSAPYSSHVATERSPRRPTEQPTLGSVILPEDSATESVNEVSLDECNRVAQDLMRSFGEASRMHNMAIRQPSSESRQKVLDILATTYGAIQESITSQTNQRQNNVNNIQLSISNSDKQCLQTRLSELCHNNLSGPFSGDEQRQTQVFNLLEQYSDVLVKLVTKKLETDHH